MLVRGVLELLAWAAMRMGDAMVIPTLLGTERGGSGCFLSWRWRRFRYGDGRFCCRSRLPSVSASSASCSFNGLTSHPNERAAG